MLLEGQTWQSHPGGQGSHRNKPGSLTSHPGGLPLCAPHVPSHRAPSVSSCVAPSGEEPATGASLPTCRDPSLCTLLRRGGKERHKLTTPQAKNYPLENKIPVGFLQDPPPPWSKSPWAAAPQLDAPAHPGYPTASPNPPQILLQGAEIPPEGQKSTPQEQKSPARQPRQPFTTPLATRARGRAACRHLRQPEEKARTPPHLPEPVPLALPRISGRRVAARAPLPTCLSSILIPGER